jgi:hypothetical protein
MDEIIKQSTELYYEIDDCITKLIKAILDKDANKENEAIFDMKSLLINTMQHISWMVNELKGNSKIKWQTGEPKENGIYLVTTSSNIVRTSYWNNGCWLINNLPFSTLKIKAWCKLSDIKPYKEEK